ncbi:hypothetical protein Tco_1129025, partial [Tanacetum coccineum]
MPTEFVFMMTRVTYPQSQQLPNVFLEYCFNGNSMFTLPVKHGDDTVYVTGYDENGFECGGYNVVRTRPSRIVTWVWPYADYPQIGAGTDVFKYQLREEEWESLVEEIGLEAGMFVVFTKHRFNRLGLMAFDTD